MNSAQYKITAFLLIIFLLPFGAKAQERLPLSQAIQRSLANNYEIQIEAKSIEVARNNNNIGEAGYLPSLSVQITQSNTTTVIDNPTSFLSGDVINKGINPTIALDWNLFDGFRARANKARLENLQKDTEGNASIVVQNTMQAVIQGYYNAVFEQERLEVFKKTLTLSREKYDYVALRKEFGSALTADLLLEESNYLQDSLSYVNQQLSYRNSLRTLNILMAVEDVNTNYILTNSLEYADRNYNFLVLYNKMTSNNVNLKRQYVSQSLLRNSTQIARADLYPTVSMRLNYSNNINAQDLSQASLNDPNAQLPQVPISTSTVNYGASFTVSYNLFNGGRIKRAIQNTVIQEQIGAIRIETLQLSLKRDLQQALDLYNTRKLLRGIAKRTKESAELNLQISEERYKNGTINSFDYRTVQNNFINAALSELQATFNLIDANTQLMRLTGGIVEEF
jgi:outer membrane protein